MRGDVRGRSVPRVVASRVHVWKALISWPVLLVLASGTVCGCARVSDTSAAGFLSILDGCPVVPVCTASGLSTAWFIGAGELVTCSHALPRGAHTGEIRLAGWAANYEVVRSGDDLGIAWTRFPETREDRAWADPGRDWALLRLSPPLSRTDVFATPTFDARIAESAAQPGEALFVVGFTMPNGRVEPMVGHADPGSARLPDRVVLEVQTVRAPARFRGLDRDGVLWVRARGGGLMHAGFSGAPLWRVRAGGTPEVCGMLIGAEREGTSGASTGAGLAIRPPGVLAGR